MYIHIIDLKTLNCESKNFVPGREHVKKSEAQKELEQSKDRNVKRGPYANLKIRGDPEKQREWEEFYTKRDQQRRPYNYEEGRNILYPQNKY